MTDARIARGKRAKKTAAEEPPTETPSEIAVEVDAEPKPRRSRPLSIVPDEKPEAEPKEDLVVFAFRLRPEERDLIHKAAGAAKASRFVRAVSLAASRGDEKALLDIARA